MNTAKGCAIHIPNPAGAGELDAKAKANLASKKSKAKTGMQPLVDEILLADPSYAPMLISALNEMQANQIAPDMYKQIVNGAHSALKKGQAGQAVQQAEVKLASYQSQVTAATTPKAAVVNVHQEAQLAYNQLTASNLWDEAQSLSEAMDAYDNFEIAATDLKDAIDLTTAALKAGPIPKTPMVAVPSFGGPKFMSQFAQAAKANGTGFPGVFSPAAMADLLKKAGITKAEDLTAFANELAKEIQYVSISDGKTAQILANKVAAVGQVDSAAGAILSLSDMIKVNVNEGFIFEHPLFAKVVAQPASAPAHLTPSPAAAMLTKPTPSKVFTAATATDKAELVQAYTDLLADHALMMPIVLPAEANILNKNKVWAQFYAKKGSYQQLADPVTQWKAYSDALKAKYSALGLLQSVPPGTAALAHNASPFAVGKALSGANNAVPAAVVAHVKEGAPLNDWAEAWKKIENKGQFTAADLPWAQDAYMAKTGAPYSPYIQDKGAAFPGMSVGQEQVVKAAQSKQLKFPVLDVAIPQAQFVPTQIGGVIDVVNKYIKGLPDDQFPRAYFWNGQYHLTNGHHRVMAAHIRGDASLTVQVINLDALIKADVYPGSLQTLVDNLPPPPGAVVSAKLSKTAEAKFGTVAAQGLTLPPAATPVAIITDPEIQDAVSAVQHAFQVPVAATQGINAVNAKLGQMQPQFLTAEEAKKAAKKASNDKFYAKQKVQAAIDQAYYMGDQALASNLQQLYDDIVGGHVVSNAKDVLPLIDNIKIGKFETQAEVDAAMKSLSDNLADLAASHTQQAAVVAAAKADLLAQLQVPTPTVNLAKTPWEVGNDAVQKLFLQSPAATWDDIKAQLQIVHDGLVAIGSHKAQAIASLLDPAAMDVFKSTKALNLGKQLLNTNFKELTDNLAALSKQLSSNEIGLLFQPGLSSFSLKAVAETLDDYGYPKLAKEVEQHISDLAAGWITETYAIDQVAQALTTVHSSGDLHAFLNEVLQAQANNAGKAVSSAAITYADLDDVGKFKAIHAMALEEGYIGSAATLQGIISGIHTLDPQHIKNQIGLWEDSFKDIPAATFDKMAAKVVSEGHTITVPFVPSAVPGEVLGLTPLDNLEEWQKTALAPLSPNDLTDTATNLVNWASDLNLDDAATAAIDAINDYGSYLGDTSWSELKETLEGLQESIKQQLLGTAAQLADDTLDLSHLEGWQTKLLAPPSLANEQHLFSDANKLVNWGISIGLDSEANDLFSYASKFDFGQVTPQELMLEMASMQAALKKAVAKPSIATDFSHLEDWQQKLLEVPKPYDYEDKAYALINWATDIGLVDEGSVLLYGAQQFDKNKISFDTFGEQIANLQKAIKGKVKLTGTAAVQAAAKVTVAGGKTFEEIATTIHNLIDSDVGKAYSGTINTAIQKWKNGEISNAALYDSIYDAFVPAPLSSGVISSVNKLLEDWQTLPLAPVAKVAAAVPVAAASTVKLPWKPPSISPNVGHKSAGSLASAKSIGKKKALEEAQVAYEPVVKMALQQLADDIAKGKIQLAVASEIADHIVYVKAAAKAGVSGTVAATATVASVLPKVNQATFGKGAPLLSGGDLQHVLSSTAGHQTKAIAASDFFGKTASEIDYIHSFEDWQQKDLTNALNLLKSGNSTAQTAKIEVNLDSLNFHSLPSSLDRSKIEAAIGNPKSGRPVFIKDGDELYLVAGAENLVAARIRGDVSVEARVLDIEYLRKQPAPAAKGGFQLHPRVPGAPYQGSGHSIAKGKATDAWLHAEGNKRGSNQWGGQTKGSKLVERAKKDPRYNAAIQQLGWSDQKFADYIDEAISDWNGNSSASERMVAFHLATANEFKITGWKTTPNFAKTTATAMKRLAKEELVMKVAVRAMYEETQAAFKAAGVTHVSLWRGYGYKRDAPHIPHEFKAYDVGDVFEAELQALPITSWASTGSTASSFAMKDWGYVTKAEIPVEHILTAGVIGFGTGTNEHEFIAMYGEGTVEYKVANKPQGYK